ncbi:iron complex outermembrane receptor protein [Erwinia toletana]|uniref:Iron complex outermembrane receptor protein n=1 Tax=Winslowiella toletana TaxID=92490 RepID=A0ABS4P5N3_9GAMM|nr:TonB-dependent siderophore receptor [Winslowiella toletana]MBP2167278.1 iron complex outermembrane receptor protein [Winslowiella toletana]
MIFNKITDKTLALLITGILLPLPVKTSLAAESSETKSDSSSEQNMVVTAERDTRPPSGYVPGYADAGTYQGRDLMDVPASVSVVPHQVIEAQQGSGLHDALRNVAGVVRQQQSGIAYDQLSVRGINLDNRSSYMFNGVLPFDNNLPIPMENKERMEVLKGASALYYGFVAPGGVVNMVTKRAGATPVKTVTFSTDDNGSALAHIDLADRFGDENRVGVRVNAVSNNIHTPIDGDNGNRRMFSAALDWQVNDRLLLKYDYEYIRARITEQAAIATPTAVNGVMTMPDIPDPSKLLSMKGKDTHSEAKTHLLQAEYAFNSDWSGKFTAGQSRTKRDRWLWVFDNYNASSGDGTVYGADQKGQDYLNQNLRAEVKGTFSTASIDHELLIGASQNRLYQPSFDTYMYLAAQNIYSPSTITSLTRNGTNSKNTLKDRSFKEQTVRDGGVFLQDWITLNDQWQMTGAVRYGKYSSKQLDSADEQVSAVTPAFSVLYKATPDISLYASYVEGLESAGVAPSTAANAGQSLKAVVSRQKEIGIRTRVWGELYASAAWFELKQASASTGDDDIYAINGQARYRGGEFSLQGDMTDNTSVMGSLMLMDAEVISSTNASILGKTPENTPDKVASLFVNHQIARVPGLSVNGAAYYVGSRPVNARNQAEVASYTTYNAGVGYSTKLGDTKATFQATVNNLTNKRYWSAAGSGQLAVGMPRTLLLSSTFEF